MTEAELLARLNTPNADDLRLARERKRRLDELMKLPKIAEAPVSLDELPDDEAKLAAMRAELQRRGLL